VKRALAIAVLVGGALLVWRSCRRHVESDTPAPHSAPIVHVARGAAPTLRSTPQGQVSAVEAKRALLLSVFPDSDAGRACAEAMTRIPYGLMASHPQDMSAMAGKLSYLRDHANEALSAIEQGFEQLPERYAHERQFMIQFVAQLAVEPAQKITFLAGEMARPYSGSTDPRDRNAFFNSATALDTLLHVTGDVTVEQRALRQALATNSSPQSRLLLLSRYESVDPTGAQAIRAELGL
jgi:hypothetical protein